MDHARFNSDELPAGSCEAGSDRSSDTKQHSITDWVRQIGLGFRNVCHRHNIEIEMDLDEVRDVVDGKPIKDAVIAMINNAIESMPTGGEVEITLVDGKHQWEIEVADSGNAKSGFPRERSEEATLRESQATSVAPAFPCPTEEVKLLPVVEPVELNRHLRSLEEMALQLGATRQTWNCPLGGVAQVLVVPKKLYQQNSSSNSGQRKAA